MSERRHPNPAHHGYAPGRVTKQLIVERAVEAFAHKGFHGASLRGIAREAGVDHSTICHHFGTKTDLLIAVLAWHDEEQYPGRPNSPLGPDVIPSDLTAAELINAFVAVAERNRTSPGLVQLLSTVSAEAGSADHPARPFLQRRHDILVAILAAAIRRQGAEIKESTDEPTAEEKAALLIASWEGLQIYDALHPGQIDLPRLLRHTLNSTLGVTG